VIGPRRATTTTNHVSPLTSHFSRPSEAAGGPFKPVIQKLIVSAVLLSKQ
jgi:hypothetical protein